MAIQSDQTGQLAQPTTTGSWLQTFGLSLIWAVANRRTPIASFQIYRTVFQKDGAHWIATCDHLASDTLSNQPENSLSCSGSIQQGAGEEEVLTDATGVHSEHADVADRPRSALGSALSRGEL